MVENNCSFLGAVQSAFCQIKEVRKGSFTSSLENICYILEQNLSLYSPIFLTKRRILPAHYAISSDSPLVTYIVHLALEYTKNSTNFLLDESIRHLVDLPSIIASQLFQENSKKNFFSSSLYWEKVCDAVILLILTEPSEVDESISASEYVEEKNFSVVCRTIIKCLAAQGHLAILLQRLRLLSLQSDTSNFFCRQLVSVAIPIFELSVKQIFSKSQTHSPCFKKRYWVEFLFSMLQLVDARVSCSFFLKAFLNNLLSKTNWKLCESVFTQYHSFQLLYINSIFTDIPAQCSPSRKVLKFLFENFAISLDETETINALKSAFLNTINIWSNRSRILHSTIESDTSLMNTIIYIINFFEQKKEKLSTSMVGGILDGVSLRLGNSRSVQFRYNGMTVAAAFAAMAVNNENGQVLLDNNEFSNLFDKWKAESETLASPLSKEKNDLDVGDILTLRNDTFPKYPDEPFFFFRLQSIASPSKSVESVSDGEIISFGVTELKSDVLDRNISVLTSIKQCYNAIIGIGRSTSPQLVEIQRSIESGLRGMQCFFESVHQNTKASSEASEELGPLVPSLLPALVNLSIHAPEEKHKELLGLRYFILISIIQLSPKISLFVLSNLLYSGNLGILVRAEIARAIGEAAFRLASVKSSTVNNSEKDRIPKHIYPPIPQENTKVFGKVGKNTRRWGYCAHSIKELSKTVNSLGDYAPSFVQALVARFDKDHFKFFQEHDPYTPCDILRSLIKIFQSLVNVRHVANSLAAENIDFFILAMSIHPNNEVKKLAWIAFEEVMLCWCGSEPHFTFVEDSMVLNKRVVYRIENISKEWLKAFEAGQRLCEQLIRKNDTVLSVSIQVIADLHDLVAQYNDIEYSTAAIYNSRVTVV